MTVKINLSGIIVEFHGPRPEVVCITTPLYKPASMETTRGEIVSPGKTISGNGKTYCETLTLKTDKGNIWVILKPENFRPKTSLNLQPRDQVEITGSRVALPGESASLPPR